MTEFEAVARELRPDLDLLRLLSNVQGDPNYANPFTQAIFLGYLLAKGYS